MGAAAVPRRSRTVPTDIPHEASAPVALDVVRCQQDYPLALDAARRRQVPVPVLHRILATAAAAAAAAVSVRR
ncbi:hypothetical protein [Streptomyces sp. NPDC002962]|uniref:hypothetical protein n=1 Tax=Streptomyces sp. NPDC002962 TaxID=3364674 RepID=UPI0036B19438